MCLEIRNNAGIVSCCSLPDCICTNYVHAPGALCYIYSDWCHCQAYPTCPRPISSPSCTNHSSNLNNHHLSRTCQHGNNNEADKTRLLLSKDVSTGDGDMATAGIVDVNSCCSSQCGNNSEHYHPIPQCACSVGASKEQLLLNHQNRDDEDHLNNSCNLHHHTSKGNNDNSCACFVDCISSSPSPSHNVANNRLLKNLILISSKEPDFDELKHKNKKECCLKRVNSEPVSAGKKLTGDVIHGDLSNAMFSCHAPLISSYSLDAHKVGRMNFGPKLRLRAMSSRHISHHSSSTEEWFEEVPLIATEEQNYKLIDSKDLSCMKDENKDINAKQLIPPPNPQLCVNGDKPPPSDMSDISHQDIDSTSSFPFIISEDEPDKKSTESKSVKLYSHKDISEPQHSLNNLLLTDSCDQLSTTPYTHHSESSLSGLYSEDTSSYTSRPTKDSETVSQAPTFDIAEIDSVGKKSRKTSALHKNIKVKQGASGSLTQSGKCCCVVL